jgi:hypothetical protein
VHDLVVVPRDAERLARRVLELAVAGVAVVHPVPRLADLPCSPQPLVRA